MGKENTSTIFIGRHSEIKQLHHYFERVINTQKPVFVFIEGDIGMGKTTLLEQFLEQVPTHRSDPLIGRAACSMEAMKEGRLPFSILFASLTEAGILTRINREKLIKFVFDVAPAWINIVTAGVVGAIFDTIKGTRDLLNPTSFSEEAISQQFVSALKELADKRPLVAFIDDLQWADESSLRLLFFLSRNMANSPILFLLTYRKPDETLERANLFRDIQSNMIRDGAAHLILQEGISVADYVAERFRFNNFPASLIQEVQQKTGGQPLFVEHLFSLWQQTRVIAPTGEDGDYESPIWVLTENSQKEIKVPEGIGLVLNERLHRMHEDLRRILDYASVHGEDFLAQTIVKVRQLDALHGYGELRRLQDEYGLIHLQTTEKKEDVILDLYRFAQRFIRDHIYAELHPPERRLMHKMVGECLEELYKNPQLISGQLSYHFKEACEYPKALKYGLEAAQLEQSKYAWGEAEQWCNTCLEIITQIKHGTDIDNLKLQILELSASGLFISGQYASCVQRYEEALNFAGEIQAAPDHIASLCERLIDSSEGAGQLDKSQIYIERGRQILAENKVPFGEAFLNLDLMASLLEIRKGNNEVAVQHLRELVNNLDQLEKTRELEHLEAGTHNLLGLALNGLNQYHEAEITYKQGIDIAGKINELNLKLTTLLNLADMLVDQCRFADSLKITEEALEIAEETNDLDNKAYAQGTRARIFLATHRTAQAIDELIESIELSKKIGSGWNLSYMYADLASAYIQTKQIDLAQKAILQSHEHLAGDQFAMSYSLDIEGLVESAIGHWDKALSLFESAINLLQQQGDKHTIAKVQRHYAVALFNQDQKSEAVQILENALIIFKELEIGHEIEVTKLQLAEFSKS